MIKFNGIKKDKTVAFLLFSNDTDDRIEIPIELPIADRISKYLGKISKATIETATTNDKDQAVE